MDKTKLRKIAIALLLAAIVAWFIFSNVFMVKYSGTFHMHDGHEWTKLEWEVLEGDADKLTASLSSPDTLEVKYDGDYDLEVDFFMTDINGESATYRLSAYQEWNNATDGWDMQSDFELLVP